MIPNEPAEPDEQRLLVLAAYDDALAAGKSTEALIEQRDETWCRLVRRLLPLAAAPRSLPDPMPKTSAAVPLLSKLGRFDIRRELGRGGFGVVFLAHDPKLGRDVALKVPRPEALVDAELRARFQHEARVAAGLDHPNLAAVYDAGEDGGICYIASAYCPGITLRAWLKEQSEPVPFSFAARLVATLAEAVEHAHGRGILHRDLKPSNIMLAEGRVARSAEQDTGISPPASHPSSLGHDTLTITPKIMDFGLAKLLEDSDRALNGDFRTQTGAIVGTPGYMAPEQAGDASASVGPATDVHALGVILYELLTGQPPYRGNGSVATLLLVRTEEPIAPSRLRPGVPCDLETICLKCLRKDPPKRYTSARALADDLNRYLNHRPILARRVGVLGRVVLWCRRRPAQGMTIAAAILAIIAVSAIGVQQVLEERAHVFREQTRYRDERDRARGNLYRALVGEARALMQGRDTGWWWKAMDNIREAANLSVADRDATELRELAIQCSGTSFPCMRLHRTLEGHTHPVTCVAISPDGTLLATGSHDRTVRLWSIPDGRSLSVLVGHTDFVTGVAFHPTRPWLATGSKDGSVRLWKIASLDTLPNAEVFAFQSGDVNALEWSPDGLWLAAACGNGDIRTLSLDQTKNGVILDNRVFVGHRGPVTCLAFSPTGQLASGSQDKSIRFWNAATGQETDRWTTRDSPNTMTFAAGSLWWGQPESYGVMTRNLTSDRKLDFQQIHMGITRQVRFDGKTRSLTGSDDGTVKLWKSQWLDSHRLLEVARTPADFGPVRAVAINAERTWIAAGHADGSIRLWQLAEPKERTYLHENSGQNAVFVGQDRRLATAGLLYDFSDGWQKDPQPYHRDRATNKVLTRENGGHTDAVWGVAASSDGRWIATASHDQSVKIWDATNRHLMHDLRGDHGVVWSVAFSPDSKCLASGSDSGSVKIWDVAAGREIHDFPSKNGLIFSVAYHPNGRLMASSAIDGTIQLYDVADRKSLGPLHKFDRAVYKVAIHPEGRWLAAACLDNRIALWDLTQMPQGPALPTRFLEGHTAGAYSVGFSADGQYLASGSEQGIMILWDARTFARIATLRSDTGQIRSVSFSRDSQLLAGAAYVRPTVVWDLRLLRRALADMNLDW